jgi:hypothetical protein
MPNPAIDPEQKHLPQFELSIPVARIRHLVQMKLNSFRPKDKTHLETLDKCGLITPAIEADLPPVVRERIGTSTAAVDFAGSTHVTQVELLARTIDNANAIAERRFLPGYAQLQGQSPARKMVDAVEGIEVRKTVRVVVSANAVPGSW